jgi:predicted RNA methylase
MQNDKVLARVRDQFYTQDVVAKECLDTLLNTISIKNPVWLEPSAGTGVFIIELKKKGYACLAFDIEPKHSVIIAKDFLEITQQYIKRKLPLYKDNLITIGNPPFGKNSSLAIKFFNHAAKYSKFIGMILPATFEKESVKSRLNKNMHLLKSTKLNNDLFYFEGKLVAVPTVFQIWENKVILREDIKPKLTSKFFEFVSKQEANFAIQRVGVAAGKVKKECSNLALSSHYFIKADNNIYNLFNKIDWSSVKYNTAGNPSISKNELILLLEKYVKQVS